jgi:putative peptidoglycan lipid II flippase
MILKNSIIIAFFSILSVLLGVVRDRLLATHVGIGETLDIYNAAFRIPDLLYAFYLAFVTSATVVPFLTVEDKKGEIEDPRKKLSSIFLFIGVGLTLIGVFLALTMPYYARYVVPGFTETQLATFVDVSRLLLIQPILLGLTSLVSCFAQLKNHFLLFGISPLAYSLGIIGAILYLYPVYGVTGLIYGVIIGAFVSFFIQLFSLRNAKMGEVLFHFSWEHIRGLITLGIPRTGLNIVTQIRVITFTGFATVLGPGVLSSYLFAQRITDAVVQIIQQSVTSASIPVLSRDVVEHKVSLYQETVKRYVLALGGVGILVSLAIYVLKDYIIYILYGATAQNALIGFFLVGFLLILPIHMMTGYLVVSLYSMKDTKSVFFSGFVSSVLGVVTAYVTLPQGVISLVYGVVVTFYSSFLMVFFLYNKKKLS